MTTQRELASAESPMRILNQSATRTLRIGQFSDSYPPIINGVSAFVSEYHQELLAQHQASYVFTFSNETDEAPPGVYRTPGIPMGTSPFQFAILLNRESRQIAETLDIYHVHEPFVIANNAIQLSRRNNRPLIFTNHTRHDMYANVRYPRFLRPPMKTFVSTTVERAIRASTVSTAPSEDTARWMRSLVPELSSRIRVMRNGIHLDRFQKIEHPLSRAEFGIPDDQIIFMYIGRLTPEKNLETLAESFLRAVQAGANAHWIIIGEGKLRQPLEEILAPIHERVHFLGVMPREQIPAHLALADVFATASLSEANPVSVIEAMAASKPFVGLQANWWSEFSNEKPGGLLADDAPGSLDQCLVRICQDNTLRAELSQQARSISTLFDIRNATAQWIELYRSLL